MNKQKIITIFFGDLCIPQGPMIHYTELWNSFHNIYGDKYEIEGWYVDGGEKKVIAELSFKSNTVKIPKILDVRYIKYLFYDFSCALRLIKNRKNIIYSRHWFYPVFTTTMMRILGIKPVYEINSIILWDAKKNGASKLQIKVFNFFEKLQIKIAAGCIGVSEGIQEYADKNNARKSVCILNGVASKFFKREKKLPDPNNIHVLYIGSFTSWDGAAKISVLAKKFPHITFHFVGDGESKNEAELSCTGLGNTKFYGFVPYTDTSSFYEMCNIGLVLYDRGGRNNMKSSSLKTLEYMANGLPQFVTNLPGLEFIEENNIGFLTDYNSDEALIKDFQYFLDHYNEYFHSLAEFRKNKGYNEHSWDTTAKKTHNFIETIFTS